MKGFTLVEIMVVVAITVVMASVLVTNFSRTRVDVNQTRLLVEDAVREAQALALTGALYQGFYRCGYGIHFERDSYSVYAGPDAATVDCSALDRNFTDEDVIVRTGYISNSTVHFVPVPRDIFFEPPKPTTFIDNDPDHAPVDITIVRGDAACGTEPSLDCRTIHVTTSGLITSE